MKSQANFLERRKRPRVGVIAQLEDITYSILRKHNTPRQGSRCRGISKSAQPLALDEKRTTLRGSLRPIAHKLFLHPPSMMVII